MTDPQFAVTGGTTLVDTAVLRGAANQAPDVANGLGDALIQVKAFLNVWEPTLRSYLGPLPGLAGDVNAAMGPLEDLTGKNGLPWTASDFEYFASSLNASADSYDQAETAAHAGFTVQAPPGGFLLANAGIDLAVAGTAGSWAYGHKDDPEAPFLEGYGAGMAGGYLAASGLGVGLLAEGALAYGGYKVAQGLGHDPLPAAEGWVVDHPEVTAWALGGLRPAVNALLPAINRNLDGKSAALNGPYQGTIVTAPNVMGAQPLNLKDGKGAVGRTADGIDASYKASGGQGGQMAITIDKLETPTGLKYVVNIPGTEDWSMSGKTANPANGSGNLALYRGNASALTKSVEQSMAQAGITSKDPVMLAGHSQGGMAATQLASDKLFTTKYNVTTVYTEGAPLIKDVPKNITVTALENRNDLVPQVDGRENPATKNVTTVTCNKKYTGSGDPIITQHVSQSYQASAADLDASTDPAAQAARKPMEDFYQDATGGSRQTFYNYRTP